MESIVIPELTLKSTLLSHIVYETLLQKIVEQIKKIPNLTGFRLSNELTALICNIVEQSVKDNAKKEKVDKKKLVIAILSSVFGLNPQEQITVGTQIEYLLENKLIKRVVKAVSTKVYRKFLKHTVGKK